MSTYDHVVIGAGSAGSAVAARLSEDPSRSVLLLEAGGSDRRLTVRAPLAYSAQMGGSTDWSFETEPEPGCEDRRIFQPRGKVLGGTSSMNAMVWVRGAQADYDGWNVPGWGWDDVLPTFRRMEDHHLGGPDHGTGGPVRVTRVQEPDELARRFVEAARASGVPARDDIGGPDLAGAAISSVTVSGGQRWSTARAYLDAARRRPNLTLVTGAHVRGLVLDGTTVVGVDYERRRRQHRATSRRDVVLSAGAFGTPHLLQLSGIGPAEHLRAVGIETVVDSPRVGAGLADHPATFMNWELAPGLKGLFDAKKPRWVLQWLARRTGKLTSNFMEATAHVSTDPANDLPDFQLINGPAYVWDFGRATHPVPAMAIIQSHWTPASRGSVMAVSPDPHVRPAIRLNSMTEPADVAAFVRAVRLTREIVATEPLASSLGVEIHPGPSVQSDDDIAAWVRRTSATTGHPACTAAMGTHDDAVLDARLRVRGVQGLRVADASALPQIPRANTNAAAIMMGERCAEMIKDDTVPR